MLKYTDNLLSDLSCGILHFECAKLLGEAAKKTMTKLTVWKFMHATALVPYKYALTELLFGRTTWSWVTREPPTVIWLLMSGCAVSSGFAVMSGFGVIWPLLLF